MASVGLTQSRRFGLAAEPLEQRFTQLQVDASHGRYGRSSRRALHQALVLAGALVLADALLERRTDAEYGALAPLITKSRMTEQTGAPRRTLSQAPEASKGLLALLCVSGAPTTNFVC